MEPNTGFEDEDFSEVFELIRDLGQTVLLDEFNHEPILKRYRLIKKLALARRPKAEIASEVARLLDLFREFGGPD